MIRKSVLLAALVTLAPAVLLAADPAATTPPGAGPHGQGQWFNHLDTNHDGAISRDEATAAAQARVQSMFDKMDTNHDGLITQDEIHAAEAARRAQMKAKAEARFKAADQNGDGLLSKDEAAAIPMLARHFDALDTNKDGTLSPEEIQAAARHHFAGRGWKGNGGGTPAQR